MKVSEILRRLTGISVVEIHGGETVWGDERRLTLRALDDDTEIPVPETGWRSPTVPVPMAGVDGKTIDHCVLGEGWEHACAICAARDIPRPGAVGMHRLSFNPMYACRECVAAGAKVATAADWPWFADRILDGGPDPADVTP